MSSEAVFAPNRDVSSSTTVQRWLLFPTVLLAAYWAWYVAYHWTDLGPQLGFFGFIIELGIVAVVAIGVLIWWLATKRVTRGERWSAIAALVVGGAVAGLGAHKSMNFFFMAMQCLPWALTAWIAWLAAAATLSPAARARGFVLLTLAIWAPNLLLRYQGMRGGGAQEFHWRWTPTAEDEYLATRQTAKPLAAAPQASTPIVAGPEDWPEFRGAGRTGVVKGVKLAVPWDAVVAKPVWRRKIGPAWSSMTVIGKRLYTQEQRGDKEAVVCLDADTGEELWAHEDEARYDNPMGGVGPRATPTFADGSLYALGATGVFNCLDAATGQRRWSADIVQQSGGEPAMWGFSCSPLIVEDLAIVFAGGKGAKNLLAYRVADGSLAWSAEVGPESYSSPQLGEVGGERQVLFLTDRGLFGLKPESGEVLWRFECPPSNPGVPRSVQPHVIDDERIVVGSGGDFGAMLVRVTREGDNWKVDREWVSRDLKPSYNDFVALDGSLYGFDANIFCCVDVATGKRRWKDGRYGNGQALLLEEQKLLLVVSEEGEVVLVKVNPQKHEELGRFQAIDGKTWNHPSIADGRLYIRNAEEIACYELPKAE